MSNFYLPNETDRWVIRLRRTNKIFLTKEGVVAEVLMPFLPYSPADASNAAMGELALKIGDEVVVWSVDMYGKGWDGSKLMMPIPGQLSHDPPALQGPEFRIMQIQHNKMADDIKNLRKAVYNMLNEALPVQQGFMLMLYDKVVGGPIPKSLKAMSDCVLNAEMDELLKETHDRHGEESLEYQSILSFRDKLLKKQKDRVDEFSAALDDGPSYYDPDDGEIAFYDEFDDDRPTVDDLLDIAAAEQAEEDDNITPEDLELLHALGVDLDLDSSCGSDESDDGTDVEELSDDEKTVIHYLAEGAATRATPGVFASSHTHIPDADDMFGEGCRGPKPTMPSNAVPVGLSGTAAAIKAENALSAKPAKQPELSAVGAPEAENIDFVLDTDPPNSYRMTGTIPPPVRRTARPDMDV